MVSEQTAGLTIDNQLDPYISCTSQSSHSYQEPWRLHQELPIPIEEEINHKNATFERTYRVLNAMAHEQLQIHTAKNQHLHPCPKPRITKTARTASPQPKNVPPLSRMATKTPKASFPQLRNVPCFMNSPLHSQEHRQVPVNHQEPSRVPVRNSKNKLPRSKTAPNTTLNIPQTEDFESSTWMIYELEHSVKVLESMDLGTIIMFIQSINKMIAETIISLQNKLLAANLTELEKERIAKLPNKIWNICIELTNHYPTGYDPEIDEFGFFAIVLDELIKYCCIDEVKSVQSDSSSRKNDEAKHISDDGEALVQKTVREAPSSTIGDSSTSDDVAFEDANKGIQAPSMGRTLLPESMPEYETVIDDSNGVPSVDTGASLSAAQKLSATSATYNEVSPDPFRREAPYNQCLMPIDSIMFPPEAYHFVLEAPAMKSLSVVIHNLEPLQVPFQLKIENKKKMSKECTQAQLRMLMSFQAIAADKPVSPMPIGIEEPIFIFDPGG